MYENFVRTLGAVFDNRRLYGDSHKVAVNSMEQAFEMMVDLLNSTESLVLAVTPDEFSINNSPVELKNVLVQQFVDLLRQHEVSTLTISRGISADEFLQLVALVSKKPAELNGGLEQTLQSDFFEHVVSHKVVYVEVSEDDVVVKKLEMEANRQAAEESIMEYLGVKDGDSAAGADAAELVRDGLNELLSSPAELGEIIVKSAGISLNINMPPDSPLPDKTLRELIARIVESLEKAFQVLKENPAARTQKGKKKLKKSLESLGKDIEVVIGGALQQVESEQISPIHSAIDAMTDELEIDALAAEYLRKRRLIESSEKRLLKYLARQGSAVDDCELKAKLIDGGFSESGWKLLVSASGAGPGISERMTLNNPEFRQLQKKLVELTKIIKTAGSDNLATPEDLESIISQVEEQLEVLIKRTEERIRHIMEDINASELDDTDSRETESSRKLTRRQLLELIAEIVQELYQPLSVVQCVVQSLLVQKNSIGDVQNRELLELADRSAHRMSMLIGEIYTVVGNPTSLTPKQIFAS